MRPTLLYFNNPDESTPGPYDQKQTYDGRRLSFKQAKGDSNRSNFARSRRFSQYSLEERKTGHMVGPGSYNMSQNWPDMSDSPMYRLYHGNKDTGNNGYFYVGQSLKFSSSYLSVRHRKSLKSQDFKIDPELKLTKRPKSSLSCNRNKKLDRIYKMLRKTATPIINKKKLKTKNKAKRRGKKIPKKKLYPYK